MPFHLGGPTRADSPGRNDHDSGQAPRQDLLAALSFLDAVDTKVAAAERERFERLRDQVRSADFAYLIWGTGSWNPRQPNQEWIDAAVNAYRWHVEPTDDELDRLEAVMYIRTLYLACFGYRRAVTGGVKFREWGFIHPPE